MRRRLRALLQGLHLLPALSTELDPGTRVAVVGIGDGRLVLGAVERVGPDGDVLAIDPSVDALEELRAASTAPNVSYLVGEPAVLPLPDASVDAVLAGPALEDEEMAELSRVTRR